MKQLLVFFFILSCLSCTRSGVPKAGQFYDPQEQETLEVYICTGKSSHAYHSNRNCYGIKACRGTTKKVTIDKAEELGRTPCHFCHE